jgi:hypothetical protein
MGELGKAQQVKITKLSEYLEKGAKHMQSVGEAGGNLLKRACGDLNLTIPLRHFISPELQPK